MKSFVLVHDEARRRAVEAVRTAPDGMVVTIKEPSRNLEQSAKFHALCSDIAKSGVNWIGKPRTAQEWKLLLVSGHAVATKHGADMVPGLENEFVNLREPTSSMGVKRMSSLIEYTQAWMAGRGIKEMA